MAHQPLQTYWSKRDFSRTTEPRGTARRSQQRHRYLIQKHAARHEHYDFRLEYDGVLLSWATPKGPSLDPADKRLAVRVEDHPVAYGDFEGTIPKGQYGGGTVMLWDQGTWEPHGDVDDGLAKGKLSFTLHGKRLEGGWALVRLRARARNDHGDNWLLIKEQDEKAQPGEGDRLVREAVTSVKSGRTMEEIAQGDDVWVSNRGDAGATGAATRGDGRKAANSARGPRVRRR